MSLARRRLLRVGVHLGNSPIRHGPGGVGRCGPFSGFAGLHAGAVTGMGMGRGGHGPAPCLGRLAPVAHQKASRPARNAERLLLETRDSAEKQFDDFQQTNADLQVSNITLNQKLSELTTLHEIGVALSATLDLDELLDKTLQAVTAHLSYDRAMILLVEERDGRRVLTSGHSIGGTPEMAALTKGLEVSLEEPYSFLAKIVLSGNPIVFEIWTR